MLMLKDKRSEGFIPVNAMSTIDWINMYIFGSREEKGSTWCILPKALCVYVCSILGKPLSFHAYIGEALLVFCILKIAWDNTNKRRAVED